MMFTEAVAGLEDICEWLQKHPVFQAYKRSEKAFGRREFCAPSSVLLLGRVVLAWCRWMRRPIW